jgi:hypothetical protein
MSETVLSDIIDDPHQRLIYEYDFLNIKTFYIELLKTIKSKSKTKPRCTYSSGEIPKSLTDLTQDNINNPLTAEDLLEEEEESQDYYDEEDMEGLNEDIGI